MHESRQGALSKAALLCFVVTLLEVAVTKAQTVTVISPSEELPSQDERAQKDPPLTRTIQEHVPGRGIRVGQGSWAELRISFYSYARYLNQQAIDKTYTNNFGQTVTLDRRNDLQLQKVMLYFKGWLGSEAFRYVFYVWTSNTSQGLGAQVVVAGYLSYRVAAFLDLGVGIAGLPTTRSVRGQWPGWLKQDNRTIADEYFRGSYTTGLWASGALGAGFNYKTMLGDNLSQLGVNAGQLDGRFDTSSTALWWASEAFGPYAPFGDFEAHQRPATSVGVAFSRSTETRQSQPGTQNPENTQIRLSDGSLIFDDGSLVEGVRLQSALYRMLAADAALKFRGFSLEGEYFFRWVNELEADGPLPRSHLFDHGLQLQTSAMLWPHTLQAYGFGSAVLGQFGRPWDVGGGLNYFPFHTRILRFNAETIYVRRSPVGYQSFPLVVGATGPVFMGNMELYF